MLEWQPILQQGAAALLSKVVGTTVDAASKKFQSRKPFSQISFRNHFDYAYERCTKIKTIVNGDRPIDLLTNYESPDFSVGAASTKRMDEYAFIDQVWENRNTVLIGSAGAGKSMFMRYFWIACTVSPRNKIPIFIELRKFNEIKLVDFGIFVLTSATQGSVGDVRVVFQDALEEGQFVFVLDGFDELRSERRSNVEDWILSMAITNNVILVSGRPDPIFEAWQAFSLHKMLPMTMKQTISLIGKIDFDSVVKAKFINELKLRLFNRHKRSPRDRFLQL